MTQSRCSLVVTLIGTGAVNVRGRARIATWNGTTPQNNPTIGNGDNYGVVGCDATGAPGNVFRIPFDPTTVAEVCEVRIYKADATGIPVIVTNGPATDGSDDFFILTQQNRPVTFIVANGQLMCVAVPPNV